MHQLRRRKQVAAAPVTQHQLPQYQQLLGWRHQLSLAKTQSLRDGWPSSGLLRLNGRLNTWYSKNLEKKDLPPVIMRISDSPLRLWFHLLRFLWHLKRKKILWPKHCRLGESLEKVDKMFGKCNELPELW